jgi:acyl-CoA reductase-like NAD-dependent aldehyde dehydrogenase
MADPAAGQVVSRDPFTGDVVFSAAASGPDHVARVVSAAAAAAGRHASTAVAERSAALRAFADRVEEESRTLSDMIVREVGKRRADADGEVAWTALSARWYADHPPAEESAGGARVMREPLGVIAVVTPWNVPLITPAWKWLPALMAGNAVVWKPSELATGVAVAAREMLVESGIPADAIGLVPGGAETARALCADPRVGGVHFTGSEAAGRALSALASPRFARCALEMSGLNAAVVLADADLDAAADAIVGCGTALAGQKCTATRRVLVADPVRDALVDRLVDRIEALRVGDPSDPGTDVGPLIHPGAKRMAERALERARDAGGSLLARAAAPAGDTLFAPALLGDLAAEDPLRTTELFAPVLSVEAFDTVDQAWQRANGTGYGLSAALYGRDEAVLADGARRLQAGVVAVNRRGDDVALEAPFGGVKRSGSGHAEGGAYAYEAVTDLKAIYRG